MSPPNGSPAPLAQWHAVTPLTRPLSISILELAPTSVTLALTRSPPSASGLTTAQQLAHSHSHHHAHTGSGSSTHNAGGSSSKNKKKKKRTATSNLQHSTANAADSEDGADDDGDESGSQSVTAGASPLTSLLSEGQTFKDMLSHGVVVTLDGMPWSRIVAHVSDDEADGEAILGQGDDQDDDGEWEDDWEPAGGADGAADEGQANTTSSARPAARRRKRKGHQSSNDIGRANTQRPLRSKDAQDRPPRWDRERAVVVVYDLDPSQEHEIELQIVGLAGEIKDNGELYPPGHCLTTSSTRIQFCSHSANNSFSRHSSSKIARQLFTFPIPATIAVQLRQHGGYVRRRSVAAGNGSPGIT